MIVSETLTINNSICPTWLGSSVGCTSAWHADGHGFYPRVRQYSFIEIGFEIISTVADSRRAVVSYWRKDVPLVLVNHLGLSLPRSVVALRSPLTDRLDMTIIVDDVKPHIIQPTNIYLHLTPMKYTSHRFSILHLSLNHVPESDTQNRFFYPSVFTSFDITSSGRRLFKTNTLASTSTDTVQPDFKQLFIIYLKICIKIRTIELLNIWTPEKLLIIIIIKPPHDKTNKICTQQRLGSDWADRSAWASTLGIRDWQLPLG